MRRISFPLMFATSCFALLCIPFAPSTADHSQAFDVAAPNLVQGTSSAANFLGLTLGKAPGTAGQSAWLSYHYDSTPTNSFLGFGNWGTSESIVLTQRGHAGIGNTAPGSVLEVKGNVKLTADSGASLTFQDASVQATAWNIGQKADNCVAGSEYATVTIQRILSRRNA